MTNVSADLLAALQPSVASFVGPTQCAKVVADSVSESETATDCVRYLQLLRRDADPRHELLTEAAGAHQKAVGWGTCSLLFLAISLSRAVDQLPVDYPRHAVYRELLLRSRRSRKTVETRCAPRWATSLRTALAAHPWEALLSSSASAPLPPFDVTVRPCPKPAVVGDPRPSEHAEGSTAPGVFSDQSGRAYGAAFHEDEVRALAASVVARAGASARDTLVYPPPRPGMQEARTALRPQGCAAAVFFAESLLFAASPGPSPGDPAHPAFRAAAVLPVWRLATAVETTQGDRAFGGEAEPAADDLAVWRRVLDRFGGGVTCVLTPDGDVPQPLRELFRTRRVELLAGVPLVDFEAVCSSFRTFPWPGPAFCLFPPHPAETGCSPADSSPQHASGCSGPTAHAEDTPEPDRSQADQSLIQQNNGGSPTAHVKHAAETDRSQADQSPVGSPSQHKSGSLTAHLKGTTEPDRSQADHPATDCPSQRHAGSENNSPAEIARSEQADPSACFPARAQPFRARLALAAPASHAGSAAVYAIRRPEGAPPAAAATVFLPPEEARRGHRWQRAVARCVARRARFEEEQAVAPGAGLAETAFSAALSLPAAGERSSSSSSSSGPSADGAAVGEKAGSILHGAIELLLTTALCNQGISRDRATERVTAAVRHCRAWLEAGGDPGFIPTPPLHNIADDAAEEDWPAAIPRSAVSHWESFRVRLSIIHNAILLARSLSTVHIVRHAS
ncbi:hypothetical protein DIPPA_16632 [Diplonema papillatum]|nr:hypothetical protein DIPPA_16632 [Diplonema papillatum]